MLIDSQIKETRSSLVILCILVMCLFLIGQGQPGWQASQRKGFDSLPHQQARKTQTRGANAHVQVDESDRQPNNIEPHPPKTIEEARSRARILHEAFSGALQVMHRDFFREGERMTLPSKSLEDVFEEMAKSHQIELRWLAVNANAMSANHKPQNEFENEVVKELSQGRFDFESSTKTTYHYAGSIRLASSCLKCHLRNRSGNKEKKAALIISMPMNNTTEGERLK